MATFDDDGEDGDICWIHAWYSCCLCQCFGFEFFELLTTLKADSFARIVFKPSGDTDGLILFGPCGDDFLLSDIPCIVLSNPELFNNR